MIDSRRFALAVVVLALSVAAPRAQVVTPRPAPVVLTVAGDVTTPLTLSVADLKAMPRTTITVDSNGTTTKFDGVLAGVVLARAGVPTGHDLMGPALAAYVRASASDGYEVVFSIGELDPDLSSSEILIADTLDGQPLDAKQGPFRMVTPHDKRGARGVHMLTRLEVVKLKKSSWPSGAPAGPAMQVAKPADVLVLAAASLQTALDKLVAPVEKATNARMRVSYAASSALARQIENGAPADVFISADLDWMDYLAGKKAIRPESRVNLLGNQLVLISPKGTPSALKIAPGFALAAALGNDRLALANPDVIPAGKYAKAALTSLGVWDAVAKKIAPTENVRAALLLVSRGEAPLGIVYRTDAHADPGVVIVDTFPESSHPPIIYPAALTTSSSPAAAKVLEFLKSDAARKVFESEGFTTVGR